MTTYYAYGAYDFESQSVTRDNADGSPPVYDLANAGWELIVYGSGRINSDGTFTVRQPSDLITASSPTYGATTIPGITVTLSTDRVFNPQINSGRGGYETHVTARMIVPGATLPQTPNAAPNYIPDYSLYFRHLKVTTSTGAQTLDYGLIGNLSAAKLPTDSGGGTPAAPPAALSAVLNVDAHRRPLAVLSSGTATAPSLSAAYSNDAGHLFASAALGAGTDPSLLVDARQNTYRVPYYTGSTLSQYFGSLQDGFPPAAGSPAAIAGLSGKYPCAVQHPTDCDYALMAYLDGTALKTACSTDAGATWSYLGTVASGVDLTASGRPALCWLGEVALLASGPGPALLVRWSADRGLTWGAPVTVATAQANPNYTATAYSGLSLLGWQGRLYLLAWTYGATGTTLTPTLWISADLGATWAGSPGTLPAGLAAPSALGMLPSVAQHRLGVTHSSADDTAYWLPN